LLGAALADLRPLKLARMSLGVDSSSPTADAVDPVIAGSAFFGFLIGCS